MISALAMLVALGVEGVLAWPAALYARIGHPVTWIGRLIAALDDWLNLPEASMPARRNAGIAAAAAVIAAAAWAGAVVEWLLPAGWAGAVLAGVIAWPLVAGRSLHDHVAAVARPLAAGDLVAARSAVALIVGRDPERLDQAGVTRAAMESLAENASDGVIAPLFWGAVFGLPGIAAYKAINTLDSMIGHRTSRHEAFGWASARIDDGANLIPARLTGALFALAAGREGAGRAFSTMQRDAASHRSPNAGWPEAALAGALGIRLSGPRAYHDRIVNEPWINGAAPDPGPEDLWRGLALYRRMVWLSAVLLAIAALPALV